MPTNFDHAPPPTTVDGLLAVPIDIATLSASLLFDAAAESGVVDATISFLVGPTAGNAIFDVRQTITAAWLDGSPIDPALLAHHDFGGGTDADLRILESVLGAGSSHTLRLRYQLALPDALASSSGDPTYEYAAGALTLKFWYTDLRAGRYLDSWLPGNLLFDQFATDLDIEIVGTAIAHTVITNGNLTSLAVNHWTVSFPAHFAVCAPMLRIHPVADVEQDTNSITLPSGANVEVKAYKETGTSTNLAAQLTSIESRLDSFDSAAGAFWGDKFLVFFEGPGGMEYAGACRTTAGLLSHEIHHSWWGRGVVPATQNDGWLDEAWTTYVTNPLPPSAFNFANPPLALHSQNPWVRRTHSGSYTAGGAVFQGLASLIGDTSLRNLMRSFYEQHLVRPVTTLELESHLFAQSGVTALVDGFHRFVYGFDDSGEAPDLWLRDHPDHSGSENWSGKFWDSPDLWIRHADDGVETHQSPQETVDNWFYARVRNRGAVTKHFMATFEVKTWAGTQFTYPDDFLPAIAATGGFMLEPEEERIVHARWPAAEVPPAGMHGCLLASVVSRGDYPTAGSQVWEDNNLAQKNLTIAELDGDGWIVLPVWVGSQGNIGAPTVEIRRPRGFARVPVELLIPQPSKDQENKKADCGAGHAKSFKHQMWTNKTPRAWNATLFRDAKAIRLPARAVVKHKLDKGAQPMLVGLRVEAPASFRGGSFTIDLYERASSKCILGGVSLRINVRDGKKNRRMKRKYKP